MPPSPSASFPSRLGHLLFPEICLLAVVAGILTLRMPCAGFFFLILLWLLDLPRSVSRRHILSLALCFCCGLAYALWRAPEAPPEPDWLTAAAYAAEDAQGEFRPPPEVRIRGVVESCVPLQDRRARIILKDVRPAGAPEAPSYPGNIVWTWHHPARTPAPGREIAAYVRLSPVRGLANPGTWDIETYWQDKGVWFRAWSSGKTDLELLGDAAGESAGLASLMISFSELRQRLEQGFVNLLPKAPIIEAERERISPASAVLPALIFGNRSFLTPEQSDLFARATLAHSLALSGLHLGFALLAGTAFAYGIGLAFPRLWLRISRPQTSLLLSLPFAGLYLWLGQAPVSLLRAACMLAFWTLLIFLRRPRVLLDGLFAALATLILLEPFSLFDISLQLSVLSVAVIGLCLPHLARLANRLFPSHQADSAPRRTALRVLRACVLLAGTSLCIQIVLLPLVVRTFGAAGVLFPLNILWLPVLGAVVLPLAFLGLLCLACNLETMAALFLHGASLPCEALMALLEWLDKAGLLFSPLLPRPHWMTSAGFWLLCLMLPLTWHCLRAKPSRKHSRPLPGNILFCLAGVILLCLPPVLAWRESARPSVSLTLLDVGQGQAALLQWTGLGGERPHGRVLIDGGGSSSRTFDVGKSIVAPALTDNALPRLTYAIASHPDTDHLSGLLFILDHFSPAAYFSNGAAPGESLHRREENILKRHGIGKSVLSAGDTLALGPDLQLEALWPTRTASQALAGKTQKQESGNNASLILRLLWQGRPLALLCGDAETYALSEALARSKDGMAAQVLVLPHHGAASGLAPGFYDAVRPQFALASCGFQNRWGFPSKDVRQSLQEKGIPLHTTAGSGQIRVRWIAPDAEPELALTRTPQPN